LKKIPVFILDLIIAYILGAIITFCAGLILYRGPVVLGQLAPSTREGILSFMKIFDFLLKIALIILIFLYFKIFPKLIGKTLGKRIFRI
jgi:uncharacterized membrane protein